MTRKMTGSVVADPKAKTHDKLFFSFTIRQMFPRSLTEEVSKTKQDPWWNPALNRADEIVDLTQESDPKSNLETADTLVIIDGDTDSESDEEAEQTKRKLVRRRVLDDDSDDDVPIAHIAKKAKGNDRGPLAQRYCFTFNNPSIAGEDFAEFLSEECEDITMAIFQEEVGANGTKHFQGYMELKKRMYTTGVHAMLAPYRMALFHAKGTKIQNHAYCTKDGRTGGPWYVKSSEDDFKRKAGSQGKRSDLDAFATMVQEAGGVTNEVIAAMPGHALAYQKHAKALLAEIALNKAQEAEMAYWKEQAALEDAGEEMEGQQQRRCVLYLGPTKCGKTSKVKAEVIGRKQMRLFEKKAKGKWWDGYKDELHVLIDEFTGQIDIDEFKAFTNKGSLQVETKGSSTVLIAEAMYFTSNRHPSEWWKKNQDEYHTWSSPDYKAVARRFAEVHWWNDNKQLVVLKNPGPRQFSEEWKKSWAKWQKFWEWRSAPNSVPAGADNYFTL